MPPKNVSLSGLRFVASCEGYRALPYNDSRGNCTVGYGHLLHRGTCDGTGQDGLLLFPDPALEVFKEDAASTVKQLNRSLPTDVSQQQYDALFSLTYNMGIGRIRKTSLWRDLKVGNFSVIPDDISSLSAGGAGMRYRRANEAAMFSSGTYAQFCYSHP